MWIPSQSPGSGEKILELLDLFSSIGFQALDSSHLPLFSLLCWFFVLGRLLSSYTFSLVFSLKHPIHTSNCLFDLGSLNVTWPTHSSPRPCKKLDLQSSPHPSPLLQLLSPTAWRSFLVPLSLKPHVLQTYWLSLQNISSSNHFSPPPMLPA